ncbi:hypothetical protein QM012_005411 [Aureobasidium pullulans]|uniref:BED-type domain-containing protein n=1 Tax=Aureobasidium pullulans TaxID=5580 RepID=A0ABR0T535_AURPU
MATNNNWRCRECFFSSNTIVNCATATNMKSHLATHGYGPWRCTGCNHIGRRREAIATHHRATGEAGAGSYFDPALNARINQEVRECRLPHQNPWTGRTAVPPHDPTALAAAITAIAPPTQAPPVAAVNPVVPQPPTAQVQAAANKADYLTATDEEAEALDAEVDWSSGSLTPLETTPPPAPSSVPAPEIVAQAVKVAVSFANAMSEVEEDDANYAMVQTWIGLLRHHTRQIQGAQTVEAANEDLKLMTGIMKFYRDIMDITAAVNKEVKKLRQLRRTLRGD